MGFFIFKRPPTILCLKLQLTIYFET